MRAAVFPVRGRRIRPVVGPRSRVRRMGSAVCRTPRAVPPGVRACCLVLASWTPRAAVVCSVTIDATWCIGGCRGRGRAGPWGRWCFRGRLRGIAACAVRAAAFAHKIAFH